MATQIKSRTNVTEKKTDAFVFDFPSDKPEEKQVAERPVIMRIKDLNKEYTKDKKVLKDINFDIKEGELLSIIGPSGAGKSTLLRSINRMIEPSGGDIIFDDKNITKLKGRQLRKMRTDIGMIFQHYNLVERSSVFENVLHGLLGYKNSLQGIFSLYSEKEKEKALEIITELGIEDHIYKRCDELSGGQKQRVGIARALIQDPKIILCDEPIASLDPRASMVIMEYLKRISRERGITVIVNLHQVDVAKKYSDRMVGLNDGQIVFNDVPEAMKQEAVTKIYGSKADELIVE